MRSPVGIVGHSACRTRRSLPPVRGVLRHQASYGAIHAPMTTTRRKLSTVCNTTVVLGAPWRSLSLFKTSSSIQTRCKASVSFHCYFQGPFPLAKRFLLTHNRKQSTRRSDSSSSPSRWRILARVLRYARIPFLVLSVYQLGYQQGIIAYAHDPEQISQVLLQEVVAGVGCADVENDIQRVRDGQEGESTAAASTSGWFASIASSEASSSSSADARRVARIGRSVLARAKDYVQQERQQAAETLRSKLPDDLTSGEYYELLLEDEDFVKWNDAYKRLLGDWTYLTVKTELPNAFVTEILPRHVFITSSMLQTIIHNDDELALVLAHELSHFILGHITEANQLQTLLRTVEILLLSMDPTEGLLSIGVVSLLATMRTALMAAHSRDNEHQADTLGLVLCARACFDTTKAARVFQRMHDAKVGPSRRLLSFADSHPPSQERFEKLLEASESENAGKYSRSYCGTVKDRVRGLLGQQQQQ